MKTKNPATAAGKKAPSKGSSQLIEGVIMRLETELGRWHNYGGGRDESPWAGQAQSVLKILRDSPLTEAEAERAVKALRAFQEEYPILRGRDGLGHYMNQAIEYIQQGR